MHPHGGLFRREPDGEASLVIPAPAVLDRRLAARERPGRERDGEAVEAIRDAGRDQAVDGLDPIGQRWARLEAHGILVAGTVRGWLAIAVTGRSAGTARQPGRLEETTS